MKFHRRLRFVLQSCVPLSAMVAVFFASIDIHFIAHAQVATSITSSGLNTVVTPNGTTYNITGGTRPGGGPNLFHSFGDFNVATNNIANFLNNTGLPTSNILSRVTGGNTSNIFGTIQTTGFGNANLFLMNPAGFLFGPGATVNVGGMVTFTSADYLRMTDGGRFNASVNPSVPDLLTAAPVAAFGFLSSTPGALTIHGSQLTATEGAGIALVGGDITIDAATTAGGTTQSARLVAPNGQINLASVASPGEVSAVGYIPAPNMIGGNTHLSQGAVLDVSANSAGTIRIRGGQLVLEEATLSADTADADGAPTAIDINLAGDLSIANDLSPAITARTTGPGNAGSVNIDSGNLTVTSNTQDFLSLIDTHTSGEGRAGNVNITTGNIEMIGSLLGFSGFVDTGTTGPGHGGDVNITATDILVDGSVITTGNFWTNIFGGDATGSAGNVAINADSLHFLFGGIDTNSFSLVAQTGRAGDITLHAGDIHLEFSNIQAQGLERGGAITVEANKVLLADSRFETQTVHNDGGGISISAATVDLTQGSQLISTTGGNGDAGAIQVNASEHFGILEGSPFLRPSGIFTQSFGSSGALGKAGDVIITTPQLQLADGGRINTVTKSSGRGGNVTINADSISMSGEFPDEISEPLFNLGPIHQSGIFTSTVGGQCSGVCGSAGNISIGTGSLTMGPGSQIDSGTSSTGQGGNITINASGPISLSGTLTDGSPVGIFSRTIGTEPDAGAGGNILLAGQSLTVSDGASVSASTSGPGHAGSVGINGETIAITNFSDLSTSSTGSGNAGSVDMQAQDSIQIVDSFITSSANSLAADAGSGGQIVIHAPSVRMTGGLLSTVTLGSGKAGDIAIQTNSLNLSGSEGTGALIEVSTSGPGHGGNISIQGLAGAGSSANQVALSDLSSIQGATRNNGGTAGDISLETATLQMTGGSVITTASRLNSHGNAGNVTLNASQSILVSGSFVTSDVLEASTGNGGQVTITTPSLTVNQGPDGFGGVIAGRISTGTGSSSNAGSMTINTNALTLADGGRITSSSFLDDPIFPPATGAAGTVVVQGLNGLGTQANSIAITGQDSSGQSSGIFTTTQGIGAGGDITVAAQTVTLQNGAQISSSSTGSGAAGNINITAGNQFTMVNSSVTTEATQSSGGIIKITTDPSGTVELSNSTISASVLDGTGGGGSVNIDPQFVILQNSEILAQAVQGPGGNINITITNGGLFLPDATSVVSASSQFGQQGTVTIQAPIAPAGGKIQPLGKTPLQVTALLSQRCAAIARGEVSSFVMAGRDTLPTEPGGWLTSPLASVLAEGGISVEAGVPAIVTPSDGSLFVSLRRLPSWTMAQVVEDDWLTGCGS